MVRLAGMVMVMNGVVLDFHKSQTATAYGCNVFHNRVHTGFDIDQSQSRAWDNVGVGHFFVVVLLPTSLMRFLSMHHERNERLEWIFFA